MLSVEYFYRVRHLTFFFSTSTYFVNGNTLSSCLICKTISFILSPNEYGCVYASLSGPAIDLQKMPILQKKNHLLNEDKEGRCERWGFYCWVSWTLCGWILDSKILKSFLLYVGYISQTKEFIPNLLSPNQDFTAWL